MCFYILAFAEGDFLFCWGLKAKTNVILKHLKDSIKIILFQLVFDMLMEDICCHAWNSLLSHWKKMCRCRCVVNCIATPAVVQADQTDEEVHLKLAMWMPAGSYSAVAANLLVWWGWPDHMFLEHSYYEYFLMFSPQILMSTSLLILPQWYSALHWSPSSVFGPDF